MDFGKHKGIFMLLLWQCVSATAMAQVSKPQYLSRWTNFDTETANEKPAAVVVDLGLMNVIPAPGYIYQASFLMRFKDPDTTGLKEQKDPEVLWQIEDQLQTTISRAGGIYYAMVTAEGFRDYYFYLSDSTTFRKTCKSIMANFPGYIYQVQVELDPYWFNYYNVYPDEYTMQIQYNDHKMEELLELGDSLALPRKVEHFANFQTESDRNLFERDANILGFYTLGKGENEGDLKYGIVVWKKHAVDRETLEPITLQLVDTAMKNGGYYDGWEAEPALKK